MKISIFSIFLFIFISNQATGKFQQCKLEKYFQQSELSVSHQFNLMESNAEKLDNSISVFPNISMGIGKYINNDKRIGPFGDSNLYLSVSQDLVSVYKYILQEKNLKLRSNLETIRIKKLKAEYFLNLFQDIVNYNYKQEQLSLAGRRLRQVKLATDKSGVYFRIGKISKFEADKKKLKYEKHKADFLNLSSELSVLEQQMSMKYAIPKKMLAKINAGSIMECKGDSITDLINENAKLKDDKLKAEQELNETSLIPSVYFAVTLTPKKDGTLNNLDINNMDYNVSLNIDFPLSNYITSLTNKKRFAITQMKNKAIFFSDLQKLQITKHEITNKKNDLLRRKSILEQEKYLRNKELRFIEKQMKNKDNANKYYELLDEVYESEINLKKLEAEIKYYDFYISFIS